MARYALTMRFICIAVAASTFLVAACTFAAETGYYSQPALHGQTLVFVSEGDLWTATLPQTISEQPIIAHRLTSGDGEELRPHISPDGTQLAFTAQYEGNADVYVMPIDGGEPTRLTFHPAPDLAAGWTPDGGSVLLVSNAVHPFNRPELWRVAATGEGAMPERYPFGECSMVSMSSTGRRFAFTRWSNEHWTWKRYRGGTAPDIWLGELETGAFKPLTSDRSNDMFPMWIGGRVYFSSDRTGVANIFSVSPDTGEADIKQHTRFAADTNKPTAIEGYDARWPAMDQQKGAQRIVFCQGGGLALLNLQDDSVQRLDVLIASDRVQARRRFTPLGETLTEFTLSPDGKTLVIGSRGEMLAANVETGDITQLTREAASREWGATFVSKDQLGLITDANGEQQIALLPVNGSDGPRGATRDREAWLFPPQASPDGKLLAFADKTLRLHVLDLNTLEHRQIDQSEAGEITEYRFSPDSQWLAYAKPMPNGLSNVFIANTRTGRTFALSTPLCDDSRPRWDPKGKYLYMLSNRNLNPVMSQFDTEHALINTVQVVATALAADTPPLDKKMMLAAKFDVEAWAKADGSDEEKSGDGKKPAEAGAAKPEPDAEQADAAKTAAAQMVAMKVDTDGLALRQFVLAIPPGNYGPIEAVAGGLLIVSNPVEGLMDDPWPAPALPKGVLKRWDVLKSEGKDLASAVSDFALSADGSTIAYMQANDEGDASAIKVAPAAGAPEDDKDAVKSIDVESQQVRVDIPAEWQQIMGEAWRLQRDFYWAPNMVGLDWPAMRAKYEALLPRVGTRAELNDLIGQLIGELGTSHTYLFGGQAAREVKGVGVGLLGADIVFDGRGYRVARILPSQNWGQAYISPLAEPSLHVKEGAYIRAINGVSLTSARNVYDLLQDQAGKMVRLSISDDGAATRDIVVKTVASEQPLRYAAWVENNRRYVEEKTSGRVGYVHIPDMSGQGLVMFTRYFYPQFNKPALVIDVRDNGGGFVSQMIIERLSRKLLAFDQPRHGVTGRYPTRALNAHMVTLIDQHAGSDGDIFPAAFRKLGLGPLIGMRTWGGVVGIRGDKAFVDMGMSTQPEFAWWETEGGWVIENVGVEPDIEIDNTPADRSAGKDPQLDRAVEYLLRKLEESPIEQPPLPAWPVRTGK
jgi:tricorn protease